METVYSRVKIPENKKEDIYKEVFSQDQHKGLKPESIPYKEPVPVKDLRDDVSEDMSNCIQETLYPQPVRRPNFPEILAFFDTFLASKDNMVAEAQKKMMMTKTRPIPAMKSLSNTKIEKLMKNIGK